MALTLKDSHSYETQIIDAVRSVNRALGGTYGKSPAIYKSEFNQYEVQLIDAIKGIGRTLSGNGLSLAGAGGASSEELQRLSLRVSKLENESFFRLVNGDVTLKEQYQNLWVPGWMSAGGVGSGGGGGGGTSYLRELLDIYHDDGGILRGNGDPVANGDTLVYDTTDPDNPRWIAAAGGGSGTGTVTGVVMNGVTYPPASTGLVNLGTVITSLSGYATQSWVQQQGYLTSFTETDPTVPSWAKAANPLLYVGTTQVQTTETPQDLTGILSVQASSSLLSKFLWDGDHNAWRFMGNLYADGWISAGGVGSGGGGGGGSSYLRELLDVYHNSNGILRANGNAVVNGDILVYDSVNDRWAAAVNDGAALTVTNYGGSTTGRIATVKNVDIYNGVKWGSAGTAANTFALTVNGTEKIVCLDGYVKGYIGTTQVQATSLAQDLTGILSINASSDALSPSRVVWEPNAGGAGVGAWHFYGNMYADGWVSAGGIGSGGGGGATSLGGLSDVTLSAPTNGQALVYRDGVWTNENVGSSYTLPVASSSTLGGVKVGSGLTINSSGVLNATGKSYLTDLLDVDVSPTYYFDGYVLTYQNDGMKFILTPKSGGGGGGSSVSWGNEYSDHTVDLTVNGVTKNICLDGYSSGGGGGATSLSGLSDTRITSPSEGQVLKYSSGYWVNGNSSLSPATASTLGGILVGSVISTPSINSPTTTSGRYYYVQCNSSGLAFVNVPWVSGSGGGGTLGEVGLTMPSCFTVSGSPLTSDGTISVTFASQTKNYVLAAPSNANGTPSFRALVSGDLPDLSGTYVTLSTVQTITGAKTFTARTDFANGTYIDASGNLHVSGNIVASGAITAGA